MTRYSIWGAARFRVWDRSCSNARNQGNWGTWEMMPAVVALHKWSLPNNYYLCVCNNIDPRVLLVLICRTCLARPHGGSLSYDSLGSLKDGTSGLYEPDPRSQLQNAVLVCMGPFASKQQTKPNILPEAPARQEIQTPGDP